MVFGAVGNRVSFCTMGAVTDVVNFGDWRRMRMWALAIAVAIAGAGALQGAGLIDLSKSIYTGAKVSWLSAIVGGFLFGFGMTLASGCGSKTLIRVGGGNLKSLVVLVFLGVAAYMTLRGIFGVWRATGLDPSASTSPPWAQPRRTCPASPPPSGCRARGGGCRSRSPRRSSSGSSPAAISARRAT